MDREAWGITVVEVLVVLGIAMIVLALTWRSDPLGGRLALRSAAALLVSDLRLAQARAIVERDPARAHGLEISPGSDRYVVFVREGAVQRIVRAQRLPSRVRITYARFGGAATTAVLFTGVSLFGAPSGGGTVTLSAGSARLCIRVAPATGRVRVSNTNCP